MVFHENRLLPEGSQDISYQIFSKIRKDVAKFVVCCIRISCFSVNNILFKYKVHQDTTDTSYIQYNTFEGDTEISLRLV